MNQVWRSLGFSFAVGALAVAGAHAQAPASAPAAPASTGTPAAAAPGAAAPAATPATAAPAAAAAPGSADGQALLQADCTSCHDLGPVNAHGRTPQEWSDLVDRMVTYGASGSDSDLAAIKAYLAKTLPPSDSAPPAAPLAGPASNTK
jgi:mono/diheme cytochrome c family protein